VTSLLLALLIANSATNSPFSSISTAQKSAQSFVIDHNQFLLNGKPFLMISGEIHPARIPRTDWLSRIKMAKSMGLNTIACYIFWNTLEPEEGQFDFTGRNDIPAFLQLCQQEGMRVMLRPGPYCCAEWEFGGFPYWLLNIDGLKLREDNAPYLEQTNKYIRKLGQMLGKYQITHDGPIVMVQVENEYGSYGRSRKYMEAIKSQLISAGFDVPLYLAEGGGQLANDYIAKTVPGVNGADNVDMKKTVDKYTPGGPYLVPEFYPGWLDHWGEPFVRSSGSIEDYKKLLQAGISVNLYMFFGGTNFAFMNGSNYSDHLEPSITSYDYDAPLDESGRPTPKYYLYRQAIQEATGITPPVVPTMPSPIKIAPISLTSSGDLLHNLPNAAGTYVNPPNFEQMGLAYGLALYRTYLPSGSESALTINGLRDFAIVMVDGKTIGTLDYRLHQKSLPVSIPSKGATLDILVENQGRINYGERINDNHKGIIGSVTLGDSTLTGWHVYRFPLTKVDQINWNHTLTNEPTFYGADFNLTHPGDTFLDMRDWNKGVVFVNGHNLGRYWNIGPQQTLYLPGCWLKTGKNSIIVFDESGNKVNPTISGLDHPILDQLNGK